jgi:sensor histidine kinase regulating citrate/malate metabolism
MKADKMKELNISFTSDGVVDGGLRMKPMDVCSIFANALDNAIEAARKVEKDPWVELKIKRTEKFFVINISNAAEGKVDVEKLFMSDGYTSKKDKEHHGFGLRNIRNAVEDYDGLVKAQSEENTFGLSIMIPRK